MTITKSLCPSLKRLTIDHDDWDAAPDKPIAPLPPLSVMPAITSLTLANANQCDTSLLSFLAHYGSNLKRLELIDMLKSSYGRILQLAMEFSLDEFRLQPKYDCAWARLLTSDGDELSQKGMEKIEHFCTDMPRSLVLGVAKLVTLAPHNFRSVLELAWAHEEKEEREGKAEAVEVEEQEKDLAESLANNVS
ncbi:hypothetical protein EK21DRAFT_90910 [Setomelanomma holmii]|uniref:Uncharacterized protein n=1 Tax=Setomelanomma holmii TaxID=210430 RepID=A0A9P4H6N4_9PLEO|nr:hypothetical protein EK21DRAFT_90910 [Setomelanomma holmii]